MQGVGHAMPSGWSIRHFVFFCRRMEAPYIIWLCLRQLYNEMKVPN